MTNEPSTAPKGPHACYLVEDADGRDVGYWRNRTTAYAKAEELGGFVRKLDPPDHIECEDDPEPGSVH